MTDLSHRWGGDLEVSASGDLQIGVSEDVTTQRILRRLLTSAGEYLWHLTYGAGLGGMIGHTAKPQALIAIITSQLRREASVAQDPAPMIRVRGPNSGAPSSTTVEILYRHTGTGREHLTLVPIGI